MLDLSRYHSDEDEDEDEDNAQSVKENGTAPRDLYPNREYSPKTKEEPPLYGPILGPALGSLSSTSTPGEDTTSTPVSPGTTSRQLIQSLTLPPVPNVSIPPSPPGSPRASTATKIAHFLELKKQGIHFNAKLASSSALANPSLLQNLMAFADIDAELGQYASTLPAEVAAVPEGGFPKEVYVEELAKSQQQILKRREAEKAKSQRDARQFVSASAPSSMTGTPKGGGGKGLKGSAAERVMAGLDRGKSASPQVQDGGRCRDEAPRKSRFHDENRRPSRSRSPKRRREGGR